MSLIVMLSIAALVWVAFHEEAWFPDPFRGSDFGERDVVPLTDAHMAQIIARAGGGLEPDRTLDRAIHRTSWGVRLLTPALVAAAFYMGAAQGIGPGSGATDPQALGLAALLLYPIVNVWVHRIEIDRDTISIMTPYFRMKSYDLRDLVRIKEDGPYSWRFHFADGRVAFGLKTLVGAKELRQRLADVLEANTRR